MIDDDIRQLQRDWQSQEYEVSHVVRRLRRARWTPHLVFAIELIGGCFAVGIGIWFAVMAAQQAEHKLLLGLSAAVMLIAVPLLGIATAFARRPSLAWDGETPESVLRIGIQRAEATLRTLQLWRWHIAVVAGFVALLATLQFLEIIDAFEFVVLYASICLVVSLGSWAWLRRRTRTVRAERDACVRLLNSLRE